MNSQLTKLWSCLSPLSRLQGHQVPAERDDGPQGLEDPPPATEEAPRDASPGARRLLRAQWFHGKRAPTPTPILSPCSTRRCTLCPSGPEPPPAPTRHTSSCLPACPQVHAGFPAPTPHLFFLSSCCSRRCTPASTAPGRATALGSGCWRGLGRYRRGLLHPCASGSQVGWWGLTDGRSK